MRLSDDSRRMRELEAGNKSVRGSFDASFHLLADPAQRALVGLAGIGCPTFASWVLAPLLEVPVDRAEEIADELVAMHLLEPAGPGPDGVARYRFHDLVRVYCRDAGRGFDPSGHRRLVEWSVALAASAHRAVVRRPVSYALVEETAARLSPDLVARIVVEPLTWVAAESTALLAVLDLAAQLDLRHAAGALLASLYCLL